MWRMGMGVNLDKPQRWKADTQQSVDYYNEWFLKFAPLTYRETRSKTTTFVEAMLEHTGNMSHLSVNLLREYPQLLEVLRMSTAPPIARDRLVGLAKVKKRLVENMEIHKRMPRQISDEQLNPALQRIVDTIHSLLDYDIFIWLKDKHQPSEEEVHRAALVVADRLCGMLSDPLIRNAQEQRQLKRISDWLDAQNYQLSKNRTLTGMMPGTYAHRVNVTGKKENGETINVPIDIVVMPHRATLEDLPLLVEAKSAGDFTNTNKRRKEEATKMRQLQNAFGQNVPFILMLGGYFDSGYLGYEAAEGIDWVWEHRLDDLAEFGL